MAKNLLVTGASGQLGQRVLELLLEAGETNIIATTRNTDKLAAFAEKGVDVRYGDFDEPDSLKTAFAGADRVLLISTDALGEPGKRLAQHKNAVQAAQEVGVKHVVYTSLASADDSPVLFAPDHHGTEQALAATDMGWTILRNNIYMGMVIQNINTAYQMGGLYAAAGDGKTAYITREDCAKAAAAALTDDFTGTRILEVSGPEALSQAEIAALASEITGEPLTYTPVPLETIVDGMVKAGLPQPMAETFASFDTAIAEGKMDDVTSAYADLTGETPTSVSEFLKANKDALQTESSSE